MTCAGDIAVGVSTGEADLTDISCKSFISDGATGSIALNNVIAENRLSVKRSTGDVKFSGCDAEKLYVKTGFRCLQSERLIPKKNKPPLLFVQNQPFSAADIRFTVRQHSQQDISSILLSSSAEKAVLFIALILSSICEGFEAPISTDVTTPSFSTQASAISARV